MDNHMWGTGPLRDRGDVAAESGVVHLIDQDTEEGGCFFIWVWLELGVDLDDEGGGDGREQTGLPSELARVRGSCARDSQISRLCSGPRRTSL